MISTFRIALAALLAATMLAPASAAGTQRTWTVNPVESTAAFGVTHLGISRVDGVIPIQSAAISTPQSPAIPTAITASLDPAGIDTHNSDRDGDLRSPHFLDTAQYPAMTFASTSIVATGDKSFDLTGNLTLHGVTKSVTLKASFLGQRTDRNGRQHVAYEATGTIKRSDFGMTFGPIVVGDDVSLTIDIEAAEKQ